MFLHVTGLCWRASSRKLSTIGNAETTFVKEKTREHATDSYPVAIYLFWEERRLDARIDEQNGSSLLARESFGTKKLTFFGRILNLRSRAGVNGWREKGAWLMPFR